MAAFEKVSKLTFTPHGEDRPLDFRNTRLSSVPDDPDYDPRDHRHPHPELKPWLAYVYLLRTMCGVGLLGMPVAFSCSGQVAGAVITIIMGWIIVHTHHLLLNCLADISKRLRVPYISYRYGFRLALLRGPAIFHPIGHRAPTLVALFMLLSQLGICSVCVVMTSDSLRDIIDCESVAPALAVLLPVYLLLEFYMKNLARVSYIALSGNVLNTVGLILVFYHIFKEPQKHLRPLEPYMPAWLFTSGMCLFNLSAVGVILTLDKALKQPRKMTEKFGVINVGLGVPIALSVVFGSLGYWAFGPMEENILRSLPYEDLSAMVTFGIFVISMTASYPLQCYPAIAVVIEVIKYRDMFHTPSPKTLKVIEIIARPAFVISSFVVAYNIPFQGPLVAFVGNLCTSLVSILFPAMMDLSLRYDQPESYGKYNFHMIKDLFLMFIGVLHFIGGVYFCGYLIWIREIGSRSPNAMDFF
ncbi:proton-coupled amino acid transporter-like protein acs [Anticarsia gemmatalis]|uniref:proton-coupled amino acid transporter-like protein acs n=1 Tax=Anticarsia gemmatalis TaxID=129554 RepID=UPI003F777CD9